MIVVFGSSLLFSTAVFADDEGEGTGDTGGGGAEQTEPAPAPAPTADVATAPAATTMGNSVVMNGGGMRFGAGLSYGRATGMYDKDGEFTSFDDIAAATAIAAGAPAASTEASDWAGSSMVINLNGAYGIMDGLEVGLNLPIVRNAFGGTVDVAGTSTETDNSGFGLGDASVFGTYEARLAAMSVGGGAHIKLATGEDEPATDEQATGSGHTDVGLHGFVRRAIGPVVADGVLGYIITMEDDNDVNMGDVFHLRAGGTYWMGNLGFFGALALWSSGDAEVAGTEAPDTGASKLSLIPGVYYKLSEMMTLNAALASSSIGSDGFLGESGIPLSSKNVSGGGGVPPLSFGITCNL